MIHHSHRHPGGTRRSVFGIGFSVLVLVGGAYAVYQLIGWFRASAKETVTEVAASAVVTTAVDTTPTILDGSAAVMQADGTSAGVMYRRGTSEHAEFNAVFTLPALAPETSYEVWMVKEGLVDVQSAGVLTVRADGSFVIEYALPDPGEYSTVVIMLEPNDGVVTPSGTIIAQGTF